MIETKNRGGRRRIVLDESQYLALAKLCEIHCTGEECAAVLGISYDALVAVLRRDGWAGFPEYFKKHSASGRASLRRLQFKAAEEGSASMLIWLGKQYLGQTDRQEVNAAGMLSSPIRMEFKIGGEDVTPEKLGW